MLPAGVILVFCILGVVGIGIFAIMVRKWLLKRRAASIRDY